MLFPDTDTDKLVVPVPGVALPSNLQLPSGDKPIGSPRPEGSTASAHKVSAPVVWFAITTPVCPTPVIVKLVAAVAAKTFVGSVASRMDAAVRRHNTAAIPIVFSSFQSTGFSFRSWESSCLVAVGIVVGRGAK